eukprot:GILJ01017338.1.p1 GENE.GILJ01017338.1~~GILJ01017338.1.p1  ORF type:complete len:121 (-),score=16.81 GILJ01017338.1:183-545(-)
METRSHTAHKAQHEQQQLPHLSSSPAIHKQKPPRNEEPRTVNVHIAELRKAGYNSLQEWLDADPRHIYVGRQMNRHGEGAVESKWHDPFKKNDCSSMAENLRQYEAYIRNSPLMNEIMEL